MKGLTKHMAHYLPLIGIGLASLVGFWLFSFDRRFQFGVAVAMALSYVVWGISHHTIHKDLYLVVVFEYVMFAIIGLTILASVIFWS